MSWLQSCHGIQTVSAWLMSSAIRSWRSNSCSVVFFVVMHDHMIMTTRTLRTARHRIGVFYSSKGKLASAFKLCHRPNQTTNLVLLVKGETFVRVKCCALTYILQIMVCRVFFFRRPPLNDEPGSVNRWAPSYIVTNQDKCRAESVFKVLELLEIGVCLWMAFAMPVVTLSYVQWVIVA